MSDIAAIAAGLTKAQRVAVSKAMTTRGIANRLLRAGLVRTTEAADGIGTLLTLSSLGLAVRAHLAQQESTHDQ